MSAGADTELAAASSGGMQDKLATESKTEVAKEDENRACYAGNINVYWIVGTGLGLWFLCIHTPMFANKGHLDQALPRPMFQMHLVGAVSLYLICMWNTFHTPSHGPMYRNIHIWLGRSAMLLSAIGFIGGFVSAWGLDGSPMRPAGLRWGLTIGGIAQIFTTIFGYYFIWKFQTTPKDQGELRGRYVKGHALMMTVLFLSACGTPASMRIGEFMGLDMKYGIMVFVVIWVTMSFRMVNAIFNKRWY